MSKDASIDRVRQEQVHAAIRVVEGVSEEEWVPEILDNPALQQCYVSLEAMALNLPASEVGRVTDLLGPDPSKIEAVDERRIQDWLKSLNLSDTSACSLSSGLIKKEESRAKSSIKEEQLSQYTIEQIRQLVSDGQIERLTVTEMKGIIRSFPDVFKNVSTAGKKADLLEKIRLNI
jgi:hypothetical protein